MAGIQYLLWLSTRRGLSQRHQVELLDYFGGAERVYFADREAFEPLRLTQEAKRALCDKSLDGPNRILERCDRLGLFLLSCQDGAYPERLLQLSDYPLVLYGKGRLFRFDEEVAIAMVGSRQCSAYGVRTAGRIAMGLAQAGALVVSGLAQGIDAASLKGALQGGGPVVSVLAGGVDVVYPSCNGWLYEDVAARGAILSENPPGTRPDGWRFPIRNRIISGLSLGVVAVEAGERSGALITAHDALDQGRDVFAVPGPVDAATSAGTNRLIAQGEAKLVRTAGDILCEYEGRYAHKLCRPRLMTAEEADGRLEVIPTPPPEPEPEKPATGETLPLAPRSALEQMGEEQREIFFLLSEKPLTADEIVGRTEIPARRVNTALTILQAGGYLKELPGRRFAAAVRFEEHE
ncbi:DNA-processing protein DprA [uncultured Flavonifractor sp.]|uniref:DNA-processing protein DprA n=1 Tax=Candidatus Flavonifractor intestinigallinarum TaxID=2838586 RepID=A0A9D2MM62_9FIRM|nr:DNA-processing protein DprA [uncultured Flavonifractor sp.]HJB79658.1 DNA-processing protein DprA [Candidatus Flavonifractor intestinigallinarum]